MRQRILEWPASVANPRISHRCQCVKNILNFANFFFKCTSGSLNPSDNFLHLSVCVYEVNHENLQWPSVIVVAHVIVVECSKHVAPMDSIQSQNSFFGVITTKISTNANPH